MASGTFLYVAVLDILAEEFENPASWRKRYVALLRLLSSSPLGGCIPFFYDYVVYLLLSHCIVVWNGTE